VSESVDVKAEVVDEITDQVDVGSLVTGDDVTDQLEGESLGRSVGEAVGTTVGRYLGRKATRWLRSKLPFGGDTDGDESLLARIGGAFVVALGRTLNEEQVRDPLEKTLRQYVEERERRLEEAKESASDAADSASDAASDAADSTSDAASDAADSVSDAASLDTGQMEELRKDTYRDLLEMMEYSKLQSIAKDAGVKANQSRDEMIDAIVEQFEGGSEDESEADGGDGDDASSSSQDDE
jgi:hypothetical protein